MQPTARSVPVDELARSRLGPLGRPLGSGGQATVYEVPALRLPDVGGPLVYKEYKAGQAPPGGLATVVALRNRLDPARRNRLDQITAWPSRIVTEHGAVRGVVMPRIPDGFLQDMLLPGTGAHKINPREVQNLFIPPERAQRLGMPVPTPEQRLAVCRDFAAAVAFLHDELNVVFGDVNAKNELFRLDAEPMVMFVDCDAVRKAGHIAVVQQLNAPDWEPAEGSVLTKSTDRYKLGLFILRCLTPGLGCSVNRDPSRAAPVLDAAGMGLLTRALQGAAPHDRPTAAQWWRHLCRMLGQPADRPVLHRVGTDRTIVSAGTPVLVHWVADDARTVEVAAPGCPVVRVDVQDRSGSVPVYPARAGMLQVWVRNSFGADQATIGPVAVVDLPTTSTLPVPLPRCPLPDLRALALPGIAPVPLPAALSSAQHWPLPADMLGPSTEPPGGLPLDQLVPHREEVSR